MIQVIKIGGGVLENEAQRNASLHQFAAIEGPKVLVHGGGRLATTMVERLGIETQMIDGRRVTDKETLDIVTMVYGGLVNKQVVAQLQTLGVNAIGLTGVDGGWMKSVKRPIKNGIDYGSIGNLYNDKINAKMDAIITSLPLCAVHQAIDLLLNSK